MGWLSKKLGNVSSRKNAVTKLKKRKVPRHLELEVLEDRYCPSSFNPLVGTSQPTVTYGTPVTFKATETAPGISLADTLNFYDGSTFLGQGNLQSFDGNQAVWIYTTAATQLQAGLSQQITADYIPTGMPTILWARWPTGNPLFPRSSPSRRARYQDLRFHHQFHRHTHRLGPQGHRYRN